MFQGRSQEGKGRQPYRAARIAFWHFAGLRKRIGSDGLAARAAAVCGAPITSTPCGLGGIAAHQRGCTNTRGAVSRRAIGGAASPTQGQRRTRLAVAATRLHRCLCARRATCRGVHAHIEERSRRQRAGGSRAVVVQSTRAQTMALARTVRDAGAWLKPCRHAFIAEPVAARGPVGALMGAGGAGTPYMCRLLPARRLGARGTARAPPGPRPLRPLASGPAARYRARRATRRR